MTTREIDSADDVTAAVLEAAELVEEFYLDGPIEWDSFWDRLADYGYDLIDLGSPAASKIQRHIRELRR